MSERAWCRSRCKRGDRIDVDGREYVVLEHNVHGSTIVRRTFRQWLKDLLIEVLQ